MTTQNMPRGPIDTTVNANSTERVHKQLRRTCRTLPLIHKTYNFEKKMGTKGNLGKCEKKQESSTHAKLHVLLDIPTLRQRQQSACRYRAHRSNSAGSGADSPQKDREGAQVGSTASRHPPHQGESVTKHDRPGQSPTKSARRQTKPIRYITHVLYHTVVYVCTLCVA